MDETETVHYEPLRLGILPVTVELLEMLFCLPEGYKIVDASYDARHRTVSLTLASDMLPEAQLGKTLPRFKLSATVEYHPDAPPEYRKITTEVKAL